MDKKRTTDYLILYFAFLAYSFSAVCAKMAALQTKRMSMLLFFAAEIIFLGIYALIYQQALKRFTLVVAMSNKGITVILSLIWSVLLFGETVGVFNVVGALFIILGIGMVSSDV